MTKNALDKDNGVVLEAAALCRHKLSVGPASRQTGNSYDAYSDHRAADHLTEFDNSGLSRFLTGVLELSV